MRLTLTVIDGPHKGHVFAFAGHDTFLVGRSTKAHFQMPRDDRYFSRIHFMIEINPPRCRLTDMDSRNGTYVNGEKVTEAELKHDDQIRAGRTILRVSVEDGAVAPTPALTPAVALPTPPPRPAVPVAPAAPRPAPAPPIAPVVPVVAVPPTCRACAAVLYVTLPTPAPLLCPNCEDEARRQEQPIPGYRIVRELGKGGMGVVHLALRLADSTAVALKTVIPAGSSAGGNVERFLREARILHELNHQHIVRFHEMGQAAGVLFFTMEYVRGADAGRVLKEQGPLEVERAVKLGCQLLEALEYAHGLGYVHRDIKPANVLVAAEQGRELLKVTDFGLARVYQSSALSGLTLAGEMGGTPTFMAPEQITNFREAKPAADQYSAAASLYNLLTGQHVYDLPARYQQLLMKILTEEPVPIRARRPDLPKELASIIHRALAREPGERFPDARAMRRALLALGY